MHITNCFLIRYLDIERDLILLLSVYVHRERKLVKTDKQLIDVIWHSLILIDLKLGSI